jgi:LmbE family N-acetylglucosaminyl deacetylase
MASKKSKKAKKLKKTAPVITKTTKKPEIIRPLSVRNEMPVDININDTRLKSKKSISKKTSEKLSINTAKNTTDKQTKKVNFYNQKVGIIFACFSIFILIITTLFWSYLGAKIAMYNADQLVDPYLFKDLDTFKNALFPGAHSFLIKWPIFYVIKLLNFSALAFISSTLAISLVTVLGFALIIYKINRRPIIFGTIILAMSSVLVMIPATPYAGALLPVNMAMLATRNIEYLLFIIALGLLIKARRLVSWKILLSLIFMTLLIASDKFFASISLAGAMMAFVIYFCSARNQMVRLALKWGFVTVISILFAISALWLISRSNTANIVDSGSSRPYSLIQNQETLGKGLIFASSGIVTNFGANPVFNAIAAKNFSNQAMINIKSVGIVSFVTNICIMLVIAGCVILLIIKSFKKLKYVDSIDNSTKLSIVLIWSTVAAILAFIIADHYYPVDARYLAISFFAGFVVLATVSRSVKIRPKLILVLVNAILLISISAGLIFCYQYYSKNISAVADISTRNIKIADFINNSPVDNLVGDYWRVVPIKQLSDKKNLNIVPLGSCLEPRQVLTSKKWQNNLKDKDFVYLLSYDKSQTDYPRCSLNQIINNFGNPDSQIVISGTQDNPKEVLLYYSKKPNSNNSKISNIGSLKNTQCQNTIMNIVAHQDDDILFMNPDLQKSVEEGICIRTIYITAGDDGNGNPYWVSREKGSEAAYSNMLGTSSGWTKQIISLDNHEFLTIATPENNNNISLIFMNLPDGGLHGEGFNSNEYLGLSKLLNNSIDQIYSVDRQSSYTKPELINALTLIMKTYRPTEVRTQSTQNMSDEFPDHSDHISTGYITSLAYENYKNSESHINYYIGYPIRDMPQNVFGVELKEKINNFLKYAQYDGAVCQTSEECNNTPTYGSYLKGQYKL